MTRPASQVLLIDDDAKVHEQLRALLRKDHIELASALDGEQGLALSRQRGFDLILLDIGLPGISGFNVLKRLKEDAATESIPIILLTASSATPDKLRGFEKGAVDYVTKPFEAPELRARVCAALRAKHLQDQLTQANRELVAARVAAEAAARSKLEFVASVSHEIRTPMNGLVAMAGLLCESPLTNEQRAYVETIHSCSDSLLTIIDDILNFTKIEAGRLELENRPFDLRTCVEEALDLLAAKAAEKKLELACQVDDEIPARLFGDVTRLRQVLVNLVGNGVKFTNAGEVVVQVKAISSPSARDAGAPSVEALIAKPSKTAWQLQFSVRDTGIGIPADRLTQLFKPFSQGDASITRQFGGTGLGLAICKKLVEGMGGKMWVESKPQKGSTFHFVVAFEPADAASAAVPAKHPAYLAGLRLLIVDDSTTACNILTSQTRKCGMIPRGTQSAHQALHWLEDGEEFDLAVLDLRMSGMDGLALAREIRKLPKTRELPLVLLTSVGTRTDAPEFADAGFAGCVTKPVKAAQLQEVLSQVVSGAKPAPSKTSLPTKLDPTLALRLPLRILLCEDNLVNQKVALRLLHQTGYCADVAASGLEALSALDRQPYDLVFMDIQMPDMDGLEATRVIRERQRQKTQFPNYKSPIIIVAMTASAMLGDREKCLEAGMDDYLAKPIRPEDVRRVLERWGAVAIGDEQLQATAPVTEQTSNDKMKDSKTPSSAPATEPSPVNLERLMDFSEGTEESLRELIDLYLKQTIEQLDQLESAVSASDADAVRRLAHSCAGASATCGMTGLVKLLREMERQGHEGALAATRPVLEQARREFSRIRDFLANEENIKKALSLSVTT